MPIYDNTSRIGLIRWGDQEIRRVFFGDTLVYDEASAPEVLPPLPAPVPFYHFAANQDVYSDTASSTPALTGEKVGSWGNQGSQEDAKQTLEAKRPTLRTGGINGRPYLDCSRSGDTFFENLAQPTIPSGITSFRPRTVFVVAQGSAYNTDFPGTIFGTTSTSSFSKATFRLRYGYGYVWKPEMSHPTENNTPNGLNIVGVALETLTQTWWSTNSADRASWTNSRNAPSAAINGMGFLKNPASSSPLNFDGRLYEVLYYDEALSPEHMQQVMNHLRVKYGLPAT